MPLYAYFGLGLKNLVLFTSLTLTVPRVMKKKHSERRKYCTLAVVMRSQKISPAADPLPGVCGGAKI